MFVLLTLWLILTIISFFPALSNYLSHHTNSSIAGHPLREEQTAAEVDNRQATDISLLSLKRGGGASVLAVAGALPTISEGVGVPVCPCAQSERERELAQQSKARARGSSVVVVAVVR